MKAVLVKITVSFSPTFDSLLTGIPVNSKCFLPKETSFPINDNLMGSYHMNNLGDSTYEDCFVTLQYDPETKSYNVVV